jgi:hypothetical protein
MLVDLIHVELYVFMVSWYFALSLEQVCADIYDILFNSFLND